MNEVMELLRSGRTLEAIKCYKELYDCSLQEAKEEIDKLREEMQAADRDGRFSRSQDVYKGEKQAESPESYMQEYRSYPSYPSDLEQSAEPSRERPKVKPKKKVFLKIVYMIIIIWFLGRAMSSCSADLGDLFEPDAEVEAAEDYGTYAIPESLSSEEDRPRIKSVAEVAGV